MGGFFFAKEPGLLRKENHKICRLHTARQGLACTYMHVQPDQFPQEEIERDFKPDLQLIAKPTNKNLQLNHLMPDSTLHTFMSKSKHPLFLAYAFVCACLIHASLY